MPCLKKWVICVDTVAPTKTTLSTPIQCITFSLPPVHVSSVDDVHLRGVTAKPTQRQLIAGTHSQRTHTYMTSCKKREQKSSSEIDMDGNTTTTCAGCPANPVCEQQLPDQLHGPHYCAGAHSALPPSLSPSVGPWQPFTENQVLGVEVVGGCV